jgi:hypothetical protein
MQQKVSCVGLFDVLWFSVLGVLFVSCVAVRVCLLVKRIEIFNDKTSTHFSISIFFKLLSNLSFLA